MSNEGVDVPIEEFLARHDSVQPRPLLAEGTVVGDWRITVLLGRGGSAEVYRALQVETGEEVAIKLLMQTDEVHRTRLAREREFLTAHPFPLFPQVKGWGETEGRPYLVLELLNPIVLPNDDAGVADLLLKVSAAVERLHRLGFVHRDVKPRNVLCRKDGTPVLIDFGLIRRFYDAGTCGGDTISVMDGKMMGVGTLRYAAPEQFMGGMASPSMDVHALGMFAEECFGGKPPSVWRRIIRGATSSIPRERYADVGLFARAVRRRHWKRRLTVGVSLMALLVATGWGLVAWWTTLGRELYAWHRLCETVEDAQGKRVRLVKLEDKSYRFVYPVKLSSGWEYQIIGPGELEAPLVASGSNVVVRMMGCLLRNTSAVPIGQAGIRYEFPWRTKWKNYLNFTAQESATDQEWTDHVGRYNDSNTTIRFKGPNTWKELWESDRRAAQERLRKYERIRNLPPDQW